MKIPTSYAAALSYLGNKQYRPAANNTRIYRREGGRIALRLHHTDIVTWNADGSATLNSGGWRTVTTKARINAATSARLYQKGGVWFYGDGHPFEDGDVIDAEGGRMVSLAAPDAVSAARDLAKRIGKFSRDLAAALPLPGPGPGDCWYCSIFPENQDNAEHLLSHIEDGYFVPSLALRALREARAGDVIVSATFTEAGHWTELARNYTARAVRSYMKRRLGIAR